MFEGSRGQSGGTWKSDDSPCGGRGGGSVGFGHEDALGGGAAGEDAGAGFGSTGDDVGVGSVCKVGQRDATDGRFGLILDTLLRFREQQAAKLQQSTRMK